jgi:hypothetical protein
MRRCLSFAHLTAVPISVRKDLPRARSKNRSLFPLLLAWPCRSAMVVRDDNNWLAAMTPEEQSFFNGSKEVNLRWCVFRDFANCSTSQWNCCSKCTTRSPTISRFPGSSVPHHATHVDDEKCIPAMGGGLDKSHHALSIRPTLRRRSCHQRGKTNGARSPWRNGKPFVVSDRG